MATDIPQFAVTHEVDGYYWYLVDAEGSHVSDAMGPYATRNDAEIDAMDAIDAALDLLEQEGDMS